MVIFLFNKYIMDKIFISSQEELDDAIYSSRDGKIDCCIENINDDKPFGIEIYSRSYLIDGTTVDVISCDELMDSNIGKAIKEGKLYMID